MVPVSFRYNPDTDAIGIGGHEFAKRKKFRDVAANPSADYLHCGDLYASGIY